VKCVFLKTLLILFVTKSYATGVGEQQHMQVAVERTVPLPCFPIIVKFDENNVEDNRFLNTNYMALWLY